MTYYKKTRELSGDVSERKCLSNPPDGLVSTPEFELRRKFVTGGHLGRPEKKKQVVYCNQREISWCCNHEKINDKLQITRRSIRHVILLFIGKRQAEVPTEQRSKSRFKMHVLEEIKAVWAGGFFCGWWCHGAAGTMEVNMIQPIRFQSRK